MKPAELEYWQRYGGTGRVHASYVASKESTDRLIALYLAGKKWAGSGLAADYESCGDALPQVGDHWILLNSLDQAVCIARTERVTFHKFKDVPLEVAIAEGEGDLSLEAWREIHRQFFSPYLSSWGVADLDSAVIVTEFIRSFISSAV